MDTFINESWLLAQLEILVKKKKQRDDPWRIYYLYTS